MVEEIHIKLLNSRVCLEKPQEIGLDENWKVKSRFFDDRMKLQGLYIFHTTNPLKVIYVGKTRGSSMDFKTRLYRHATKSASQSNPKVYQKLKQITSEGQKQIFVSLITTEQIRDCFSGKQLSDEAIIDTYEQLLIHSLNPEENY